MLIVSDALVYLLYRRLARTLSETALAAMLDTTKSQIGRSIDRVIDQPRRHNYFLVEQGGRPNPYFVDQVMDGANLHHSAEPDSWEFRQRLGEELMIWFLNNGREAERCGLYRDVSGSLYLKPKGIDNTGCS